LRNVSISPPPAANLLPSSALTPAAVSMPPIQAVGSSTTTFAPRRAAWIAAPIPAVPPP
jgi:hypothetical protein